MFGSLANAEQSWAGIVWACLLLLSALIILYVGVSVFRRYWLKAPDTSSEPWTLDDLRKMRDQGQLTQAEFESLRAAMIGSLTGDGDSSAKRAESARPNSVRHKSDFDVQ